MHVVRFDALSSAPYYLMVPLPPRIAPEVYTDAQLQRMRIDLQTAVIPSCGHPGCTPKITIRWAEVKRVRALLTRRPDQRRLLQREIRARVRLWSSVFALRLPGEAVSAASGPVLAHSVLTHYSWEGLFRFHEGLS